MAKEVVLYPGIPRHIEINITRKEKEQTDADHKQDADKVFLHIRNY